MPSYPLVEVESPGGVITFDEQEEDGFGFQVERIRGLGMPSREPVFDEGVSDGRSLRGSRVAGKTLDVEATLTAPSVAVLRDRLNDLSTVLGYPLVLRWLTAPGEGWEVDAVFTGGADFLHGYETADTDGNTFIKPLTLTLETFNSPYWRNVNTTSAVASGGVLTASNEGSVPAYPVWSIEGPAGSVTVSDGVHKFTVRRGLAAGERVIVDTERGTVESPAGRNRYDVLAPAPSLFMLEPGTTHVAVSHTGLASGSPLRVNHVVNPGFRSGLDAWTPSGRVDVLPGGGVVLGSTDPGEGTFADRGQHGLVTTDVAGLVPGRDYQLVIVSDYARGVELPKNDTSVHVVDMSNNSWVGSGRFDVPMTFTAPLSGSLRLLMQSPSDHLWRYVPVTVTGVCIAESGEYFDGSTPDTASVQYSWIDEAEGKSGEYPVDTSGTPTVSVEFRELRGMVI